jgi:hypothetical protein
MACSGTALLTLATRAIYVWWGTSSLPCFVCATGDTRSKSVQTVCDKGRRSRAINVSTHYHVWHTLYVSRTSLEPRFVRKLSGSHGFAASDEQVAVHWLSNWPWCLVTADTNLLLTVNQRQFSGLINDTMSTALLI